MDALQTSAAVDRDRDVIENNDNQNVSFMTVNTR